MTRTAISTAALAAALAGCAHLVGGWTALIDGTQGLDNFNRTGDANWRAADGTIMADAGKGGFLVSRQSYGDFELRAEFWAESDTNSGIYIRCADASKPAADTCWEVNIWDIRPDPKYATGAIVNLAAVPVPLVHKAGGRWNTMEITARGPEMVVRMNGVETARGADAKRLAGPFALQYGAGVKDARGGPIKWRKVEIRPL